MIFEISEAEEKRARAIYNDYAELIAKAEASIRELRPDDPEPDIEKYNQIQKSRPKPPAPPEPVEVRDGMPIYDIEEYENYLQSPEYKAYDAENKRINDELNKLWEDWYSAGSEEWKAAREERLNLIRSQSEMMSDYYEKVFDEHFKKLGKDKDAIVASAYEEIDAYITGTYQKYEQLHIDEDGEQISAFSSADMRSADNGLFLDADKTLKRLLYIVSRHLEALKRDRKRTKLINDYIVKAIAKNPHISSSSSALVATVDKATGEKNNYTVVRPTKYVTTVDKVSNLAFNNKLTRPKDADPEALWEVDLSPRKSKKEVIARVALDYTALMESGEVKELPELTSDDQNVLDAVISSQNAGNYVFTKNMIYSIMAGKTKGDVKVPEDVSIAIDEAFVHFKGELHLEYTKIDENGNTVTLKLHEPILTYVPGEGYINGKYCDDLYITPKDKLFMSPFEKWARFNGNEIDTRDITLLDVPRLNNNKEGRRIKQCLYRRIIFMRNAFERKKGGKHELAENQRTIRYDYIYGAIGLKADELTKDKKHDIKVKIEKCVAYWTEKGLISGREHKKNKSTGEYYAVIVSFMPKK